MPRTRLTIPASRRLHTVSCRNGANDKATALIVEDLEKDGYWWAVKGGHSAFFTFGKPFRSGKRVDDLPTVRMFTYYGNGDPQRPDNIADLDTFTWLLREK